LVTPQIPCSQLTISGSLASAARHPAYFQIGDFNEVHLALENTAKLD
jgi:hypothetical protein